MPEPPAEPPAEPPVGGPPPDLAALRRPALLVRTARIGVQAYRRGRDLGRILGAEPPPDRARTLAALGCLEDGMESRRRSGRGGYLPSAHVAVLIALIAEAGGDSAAPGAPVT